MKKIIIICILILLIAIIVLNNCNNEGFANDETIQETKQSELKEVIWENKLLKLEDVIQKLKDSLKECGVNDLTLEKTDFTVINSRKRLIELLPVTKLLDKINYNQIQCFVSKFDPENYLVISKTITNVPKILRPKNIIIVNNILYNSTPYGVVKYKIPLLLDYIGLDSLNASIECGVLNDFNTYNMSSDTIFHLEGKIIQKHGVENIAIYTKFVDSRMFILSEIHNANVFSLQSDSMSINLQNEFNVTVEFDKTWNWMDVDQYQKRIFRTGQKRNCYHYYLDAKIPLDDLIRKNNDTKQGALEYFKKVSKNELKEVL
jgi:SNF2 family DNA or RNA helicase